MKLSNTEKAVGFEIARQFQQIYEKQKELLACNSFEPSEKNAYFALSNAMFIKAAGKYTMAATELNLGSRVVDAAFVQNGSIYLIELKRTTFRITGKSISRKEQSAYTKSVHKPIEACAQIESIVRDSEFFNNLARIHQVKRVIGIGMVVANIRASETQTGALKGGVASGDAVMSLGDGWLTEAAGHIYPEFQKVYSGVLVGSVGRKRTSRARRIQQELGSCVLAFAREIS